MKIVSKIVFALALIVSISACTEKENKNEPLTRIRVGYFPVTNPMILHMQNDSLFKKNGVNVEVEYVKSTNGPTLVEAFLGNQVDVALFGDQPAIMAWARGVDVRAIANVPLSPRNTWIMAADSQKIRSMKDLKGKTIAVQIGTISQHWLFLCLEQSGMSVRDVRMVNVPGGDATLALISKAIDAAVLSEPSISLCEERKIAAKVEGSHCIKTYSELLMVSGKLYRNYPEVIKSIVATYEQANAWQIDHPDEAVELIQKMVTYKAMPKDVLLRQYRARSNIKNIAFTDSAISSYSQVVGFLKDMNVIKQGTIADSIQKLYDRSFVDEYYKEKTEREKLTFAKKESTQI